MKIKALNLIKSFQYLILGGLIYLFFRSNQLSYFHWFNNQSAVRVIEDVRMFTVPLRGLLPEWFIYSLPDGLWLISFCLFSFEIWKDESISSLSFWTLILPIIAVLWEIAQSFRLMAGTFDWIDLLVYALVTFFIIIKLKKRQHEKTN